MKKGNTLGIILILIGVAWLIRQTGVLSVNWAASIKTLWPIFLVALGISFMAGNRRRITAGIWVLTFVLFIGFGIYKRNEPREIIDFDREFTIDLGPVSYKEKEPIKNEIQLEKGTEEGRLILQLGAVNMDITDGKNDLLVKLDSNIPNLEQRLVNGNQAVLEYSHKQYNAGSSVRKFNLQMNPNLLWEVDANLGAVDGELDFGKIPLKELDLKLGAGDLDLIIGDQQIDTQVTLRAGAADLNIYIPEETGLKIKSGKLLTDLSFHNITMLNQNDVYVSENYENADQKIDMDVQTAVSAIKIFAK